MMIKIIAAGLFGVMAVASATQGYAQSEVIEKRQKLMKAQSADAKAIKAAVEAKDYATVETKAKDLMGTSEQIVSAFPKGSTNGKTKAKPEIWEKSDQFAKNAKNLHQAATDLAAAAKAGNDAEVGVKVKALGAVCSSCHKEFRGEKYSE